MNQQECTVVIFLKATKHARREQMNKSHWLIKVSRAHFIRGDLFPNHRFLGVGNVRLLMQSCRFFLPTFHENFEFLKNCPYDFHKILQSFYTQWGTLHAQRHSHFSTFFDFLENCPYDSNEIF